MSLSNLTMDGLRLSMNAGNSSPPNAASSGAPFASQSPQMTTPVPPMATPPQAAASTTPQAFGIVIPGCPVRTDFNPVDASGLKFSLNMTCPGDLNAPLASIREIVFFLLPGIPLPPDHGVLCYVQLTAAMSTPVNGIPVEPTSTGFELLGGITSDQPSSVFQTGWSEKEDLLELSNRGTPITVTIAISVEPTANLKNLGVLGGNQALNNNNNSHNEKRLYVAQQIAYDLFHFMQSFDTGVAGPGNMVVPQNIFDRWFHRFENRFKRDPNFFMKKRDDH